MGNYEQARKTALDGLMKDSNDVNLLQTVGLCSFYLKEYKNAIDYFDRGIKIIPENTLLRDYKAQSLLMHNTDPGKIFYNAEGRVKFYRIQSRYINEIEKESLQISGSLSYKSLLGRFRENPAELGLDEYFMLYYGYSNQPEYSPYNTVDETFNKMLDVNLKKSAEIAEKLVVEYPVDFPLYLALAGIYKQLGEYNKYNENILRYFGFLEAVKATGEGTSPSSAWIITYTSHEKELVFNLRYTIQSQKYISENGHNFDIISCKDSEGKEVSIYFNIDRPYMSLMRSMPGKKGISGRKGK
jgi:tetratricopeptide (TPR) repeat protein